MSSNIVLNNVAENLQKSLSDLSSTSEEELAEQTSSFLKGINNLIDEEVGELNLALTNALDDTTKSLGNYQEENKQWVSVTASHLLDRTATVSQQAKAQLEDVSAILQQTIDSEI